MAFKIARGLVQSAARRAPDVLSARLKEEWLADLAAQHGVFARLRFAVGCYWAARVIAQETADPALPAAPYATTEARAARFIRFPETGAPVLMSGTVTFLLIVSLNAAVLYGLVLGLTHP